MLVRLKAKLKNLINTRKAGKKKLFQAFKKQRNLL